MVKVFGRVIRNSEDDILFDNGLGYCLLDKNDGTVTINDTEYESMNRDNTELMKILSTTIINLRNKG